MYDTLSLTEKLELWGKLKVELAALENEIEPQILSLGNSQIVGKVSAKISEPRDSFDYQKAAAKIKAPFAVIKQHTTPVTDWKAVCEAVGLPDSVKEMFRIPSKNGKRKVNFSLLD